MPLNPFTSTKARKVETLEVKGRTITIFRHTSKTVTGHYITASGPYDWAGSETLEAARELADKV